MTKVAVCTCVYNRNDYFREYLWSLSNQTFKDLTLYVWDDGSEEDTKSVIDEYKDKIDIVVKYAEPIHNIGTVKNYVVNMALKDNPKYVQLTDCDDLLEENMLERMVEEMDETGADFVICDGSTFGEDGTFPIKNDLNEEVGADMAEALIERENPFFSWAMFKTDVLREQNYRVGMQHFEDWDLYIRLLKAKKKFSIVRESLYNYRTHSEQFHKVTNKDFDKHRKNLWEINNIGNTQQ
jgi:glycosyltransferase involved in cell wall biosynthesis